MYPESQGVDTTQTAVTLKTTKYQEVLTFMRQNFGGRDQSGGIVLNRKTHTNLDPSVSGTYPFYRPETINTVPRLPQIRPPVLYLFGEFSEVSPEAWRRLKLEMTGVGMGGSGGAKEGKVESHVVKNTTHFLPFEVPEKCAQLAADWLTIHLNQWKRDEEEFCKQWSAVPKVEKTMLSGLSNSTWRSANRTKSKTLVSLTID